MSEAIAQPAKESFVLVTFTYGDPADPSYAYYTNRAESYGIFESVPAMDVEIPKNTGVFSDDLAVFKVPSDSFIDRLTDGQPTSITKVQVEEVTLAVEVGGSAMRLILFNGQVTSTVRNYQGRSGKHVIRAKSFKRSFNVKLGIPADHQCPYIFNGLGCNSGTEAGGSPAHVTESTRTVDTIEGKKLTVTASISPALAHLFRRGYISKDGINIDIRDYDSAVDSKVFYLVRQAPTSWIGQSIDIFPGCDKTIENCRDQDNEANFGGVGFGIPAYNPVYENRP